VRTNYKSALSDLHNITPFKIVQSKIANPIEMPFPSKSTIGINTIPLNKLLKIITFHLVLSFKIYLDITRNNKEPNNPANIGLNLKSL